MNIFLRPEFHLKLALLVSLFTYAHMAHADMPNLPNLSVNTYEGWNIQSSGDVITNNRNYVSQRILHADGSVQTFTTNAVAPITDVMIRFKLAPNQCYQEENINVPAYAACSSGQTSLIIRLAQPMTNGSSFSVDCKIVGTHGLQQPMISFARSTSPTLIPPSTIITQTLILTLSVPTGALSGNPNYPNMLVQIDNNGNSSSGAQLGLVSCIAPPEFQIFTNNNLPNFSTTNASSLAGTYVFTNVLTVTNSSPSRSLQFMPGASVWYSQLQQSYNASVQSSVTHDYNNGNAVTLSSTQPIYLSSLMNQHQYNLSLRSKWAFTNTTPNARQIILLLSTERGIDGSTFPSLMLSGDGSDLVAATLVVPSNTNSYDLYIDNGSIHGEMACSDTNDLAEFTNGIYTLNLLDFSNNVATSYNIPLQGSPLADMLTLLSPAGSSTTNTMPTFRWTTPTATNFNFGAIDVQNISMENDDLHFWSLGTTNYTETNALLSGAVQTQLLEGEMQQTNINGAALMSGWLSMRRGLLNVISNGFQLADAHLATSEYRVNVSNDIVQLWTANTGFFGTNGTTTTLDFGDGTQTNSKTANHTYLISGVYTARLVVASNGGGAVVTNSIVLTVYPLPTVSGIIAPHSASPAQLSFDTVSNALYQVFRATNLLPGDWGPLPQMPTSGNGSILTISDPDAFTTQRYYRLERTLPQP